MLREKILKWLKERGDKSSRDIEIKISALVLARDFERYVSRYPRMDSVDPLFQAWHKHGTELTNAYTGSTQDGFNSQNLIQILRTTYGKLAYDHEQSGYKIESNLLTKGLNLIAQRSHTISRMPEDMLIEVLKIARPKLEKLVREYERKKAQYRTVN